MTSSQQTTSRNHVSDEVSRRITCVRVLCIIGLVYVHVPGMEDVAVRVLDASAPLASVQAFVVESYGRTSAALLAAVSGWLCALTLLNSSAGRIWRKEGSAPMWPVVRRMALSRGRTMVIPMLFWGALTVLIYSVTALMRPNVMSMMPDQGWLAQTIYYVNSLLFLTEAPNGPTLHLSFMRDLFVCWVLSPFVLTLLRWNAGLTLLAFGIAYIFHLETVVILRPLLLFGFAIGMLLSLRSVDLRQLDHLMWLWVLLSVVSTVGILLANSGYLTGLDASLAYIGLDLREGVLYPMSRLFGSLSVWCLSAYLLSGRVGELLRNQSPWIFATYCSHFLVLTLLFNGLWIPLTGADTASAPLFFIWFIATPALSLFCTSLMLKAVAQYRPEFSWIVGSGIKRAVI